MAESPERRSPSGPGSSGSGSSGTGSRSRPRSRSRSRLSRRILRAWRIWAPALAGLVLIAVGAFAVLQETSSFTTPRMAGNPLVTSRSDNASILILTSHQETTGSLLRGWLGWEADPPTMHWDLWAFDVRDLRRRWVTRLGSIRRGQHDADRGILGAETGGIWVLVNRLVLVSQTGGIMGDGSMIEARNTSLRVGLPIGRQAYAFDRGMIITTQDGVKLRVEPQSLTAQPLDEAVRATEAVLPLIPLPAGQLPKGRSVQLGNDWLGLATEEERAAFARGDEITAPDFSKPARPRLIVARSVDRRDVSGATIRRLQDFTAMPGNLEFQNGGLLLLSNQRGGYSAVVLSEPRRLLVLHQDGPAAQAGQLLSCILLTGAQCWQARLGLHSVAGGVPIGDGPPSSWAVLLLGRTTAGTPGSEADSIVRVGLQDGTVTRLDIGALNVGELNADQEN